VEKALATIDVRNKTIAVQTECVYNYTATAKEAREAVGVTERASTKTRSELGRLP